MQFPSWPAGVRLQEALHLKAEGRRVETEEKIDINNPSYNFCETLLQLTRT